VTKFVRSFGAPPGEADDLVQEVFIRAWRALGDYDRRRPFRAWLFQIALNRTRDAYRRRKVRDFFFGAKELDEGVLQVGDETPDPETQTHDRRVLADVAAALADLPEDQRAALVLTSVSGLSYPEAAAAMGVTVKAIEGRIARARQRLTRRPDAPHKKYP
jgi:RNA polymerase sigma-70 factor (ECF subfamily)